MAGSRSRGEGSITYDKRRKRYRARVTVGWELNEETGRSKQIIKTIGSNYKTKGEASAALAEYLKNPFDLNNKDITFSQLYEKWLDVYLKDHESSKYHIQAAYKYSSSLYNKKMREITIVDMKECIDNGKALCTKGKYKGQMRPASPQTKESMKILFNNIFAYALEARIVDRNYARDFSLDKKVAKEKEENRKIKIPFSYEEMDRLWDNIDYFPFADMVLYACYSGWRATEIINLKIKDVNLEEGYVIGGIKTQAGKNRIVPIHPKVKFIVEKYYNEAISIGSDYLFNDPTVNSRYGTNLSKDQFYTRFYNVVLPLKFGKDVTPHYTRHTFVTRAKENGVNEYILKIIIGHQIRDITESVYTHRSLEELKKEMGKIKLSGNELDGKNEEQIDDEELYKMYMKLKERFEGLK